MASEVIESSPFDLFNCLMDDVQMIAAQLNQRDTATDRRNLVRAVAAGIEGVVSILIDDFEVGQPDSLLSMERISVHEYSALLEQTYHIRSGEVVEVQRWSPVDERIKLLARILERLSPEIEVDFDGVGWSGLQETLKCRHRIVHPKTLKNFEVTDHEVKMCEFAHGWILRFVENAMALIADHAKKKAERAEKELEFATRVNEKLEAELKSRGIMRLPARPSKSSS